MDAISLKKSLETYIANVERLGSRFDFFKIAPAFNRWLKEQGHTDTVESFFAKVFDELENEKSPLAEIPIDKLKFFFKVLPDRFKGRISDKTVVQLLPEKDWRLLRSDSWVKKYREERNIAACLHKVLVVCSDHKNYSDSDILNMSRETLLRLLRQKKLSFDAVDRVLFKHNKWMLLDWVGDKIEKDEKKAS